MAGKGRPVVLTARQLECAIAYLGASTNDEVSVRDQRLLAAIVKKLTAALAR